MVALASLLVASAPLLQSSFTNWESPQVHPLDSTPSGARLLVVNTADDRLEVFDANQAVPVRLDPVPVGVDPVSVRARNETEAWVVNLISDSISIVDLSAGRVVRTLASDDEPCDVVFAGVPERAFVSCSQANTLLVFDPADLDAAPIRLNIDAEDPRALAVSPDGLTVYAAIFESGSDTTILAGGSTDPALFPPNVVQEPGTPHGTQNPPPNDGGQFQPPLASGLPAPPEVGLIVRKHASGAWIDDNGGDWTAFVSGPQAAMSGRAPGWDLLGHDVAVIDAQGLGIGYVDSLMNANMALAVRPSDGLLSVIGTDATNEVRFEPVLNGRFLRVLVALVDADTLSSTSVDLNQHLDYSSSTVAQSLRDQSIGDPRGIVWNAAGNRAYVSGLGSNNVVVIDAAGARAGVAPTIEVGEGPTGLVLDESNNRLFVLNRFDASVSVVDLAAESELMQLAFHDPTPQLVRVGRRHLYDTHATSGSGHVSCAACHIDARTDRLGWDLGDPGGSVKDLTDMNLAANLPIEGNFEDFHPMKGPMLTQTFQDIVGKEPFHWRGDRLGIEEFNGAFESLLGDDEQLTSVEMQQFEDYLATITIPPNPFRELDNSLPSDLALDGHFTTGTFGPAGQPLPNGNAQHGLQLYRPPNLLDDGGLACVTCHTLPVGIGPDYELSGFVFTPLDAGLDGERHHMVVPTDESTNVTMKVPQMRTLYERTGFHMEQPSRAGFGYVHDGSVDTLERFVSEPLFELANDQEVADLVAFMLAFAGSDLPQGSVVGLFEPPGTSSLDTHAAVGTQLTLRSNPPTAPESSLLAQLIAEANATRVGLVAKTIANGAPRGFAYQGGDLWQADRVAEQLATAALEALAGPGSELTISTVVAGTETRIGIDRDEDGYLDGDERDAASDPADAASLPGGCGVAAPATPAGFAAAVEAPQRVSFSWDDVMAETGYRVLRAAAGSGAFAPIATLPADATEFTDIGLSCGVGYDYALEAFNCGGASPATSASPVTATCAALTADVPAVSVGFGGQQTLTLDAGAGYSDELYWLLGSTSGTAPGTPLAGFSVPLNQDFYTGFTLQNANQPPLAGSLGVLDGAGRATASFSFAPGTTPSFAGLVLHHAYVVLDGSLDLVFVSNAVPLTIAP